MEYIVTILKSSLMDFRRNKLRTLLTSLGIMIGITSVVLLLAFGLGFQKYIENQFQSLGANLIMVTPGKLLQGGMTSGSAIMSSGKFDEKDILSMRKVKNLGIVVPVFSKYVKVQSGGNSEDYELVASTPEIFPLMNFEIEKGELFNRNDLDQGNKVIVLGSNPAEKIFGKDVSPVGKTTKLGNQNFKVIGVLKSKGGGGFGAPSMDDHVFIPFKSSLSFNPSKKYWGIYAKAVDETILTQTKENIKTTLLKRYNEDDFSVNDQREFLDAFSSIINMINIVLIAIATISLIVGGVGVMNIMYISVVERVNEIGIRRAYGAMKKDILFLFLTESIILSIIGGVLGLSLSFIIVTAISRFFPAYINLPSVLLAIGTSTLIGVIFGVFPSRKAANLTPIEAIRHE